MREITVCFVSASGQNVFFDELLGAFRHAAEASAGVNTTVAVDHFPAAREGLVYVFVPHEYYPLTFPVAHPSEAQLERTVAICTEQPGTQWFEEAAAVAVRCGGAVDINDLGVAALRERGINAQLLSLGYVPDWDAWGGQERERPLDVTFMGGATTRRMAAVAACGDVLTTRRSALHLYDTRRPHTASSPLFFSGRRKWEHLARTKIILNVHRDVLGYLEWQRVLGAMANGCVVLTEHSLGIEPLQPGVHYVSGDIADFPFLVEHLLESPDRLAEIRTAAYRLLTEEMPLSASIGVLGALARELATRPLAGRARSLAPSEAAPKPPPAPQTEYERILSERGGEASVMRMAMKRLLLEHRELQRGLVRLEDRLVHPEAPEYTTEEFRRDAAAKPDVSVLVSVYNYREHVEEALRSVSTSTLERLELVVVDDASTDGSPELVADVLRSLSWVPSVLIRRRTNGGLPSARNLAAEHARAENLFILDADNTVYPHALARLHGALSEHPDAAFAYGILEERTGESPTGLISWHGWDPRHLRFGNFIDAMAMIRREPLMALGGFATDPRLYGWEDFALWCAFAEEGWSAVQVPEIVGRYRVVGHSMIAVTNIDASEAWTTLARKHPFLMSGADAPVSPRV